MAQIVEKSVQSSLPVCRGVWFPARPLKLHSRSFSKDLHRSKAKGYGVVYSTLSDVRTKEPFTTLQLPQNGVIIDTGTISLQAKITVRKKRRPNRDEILLDQMDVVADRLGQNITLQLISVDIDPVTKVGKRSQVSRVKDWVEKGSIVADKVQYTAEFVINKSFGTPGALIIINRHQNEFFLETVTIVGHPLGNVHFHTHSWVHSEVHNPVPRVFFSNQVYLPNSTPEGLRDLREQDLQSYRGNGKGVRKKWENVYDYDVYNDLCNVDKDKNLERPILGGSKAHPFPRRNRTGRARCKTDPSREMRLEGQETPYVPRDEAFEQIKQDCYFSNAIRGLVQQSVPNLLDHFGGSPDEFDSFEEIDRLYCEGITIQRKLDSVKGFLDVLGDLPLNAMLPDVLRVLTTASTGQPNYTLRYPRPQILTRDKFAWLRDDEFGRQTLAGLHPCALELLKVFPPVSALDDSKLYGPRKSSFEAHHIENQLEGLSVDEALEKRRLFILDYHDIYLPYINRINASGGRASYASRTIFFLTFEGTLTPLAIELSLPPPNACQRVFVHGSSASEHWLWTLAKAHVNCNDAGYHQLVSHWLRTHASTEPYVIATNRQLSSLHPIFKLLHPHFRYTLEINAAARQSLISAGGIIEQAFLPGCYAIEMSSAVYGLKWRFDKEALPEDLISRGVAVEDPTSPHGVKLVIEDYPFAADGLLVWSSIESWVVEYVSIYYKNAGSIQNDQELQKWWEEIRTCGHADKKDEEWWPQLNNEKDLIRILTTIIWGCSGFHAAVNFGQFAYAGFMPNKPTLLRKLIPEPNTPDFETFMLNPQEFFLSTLPNQTISTVLMAVIESLSTHSPDEEYLGSKSHPAWFGCAEAAEAYERFHQRMKAVEHEIQSRNADPGLRNRNGAGILPYELLLPTSEPGITGRGVPNSISI